MNLASWVNVKEHFLVKCKYCKLIHNYDAVSLSVMKYHIEHDHPEKVNWEKENKK